MKSFLEGSDDTFPLYIILLVIYLAVLPIMLDLISGAWTPAMQKLEQRSPSCKLGVPCLPPLAASAGVGLNFRLTFVEEESKGLPHHP